MNKSELNKRVHATARALREKNNDKEPYKVYLKDAWVFWRDKMKNQQSGIILKITEIKKKLTSIYIEFKDSVLNEKIKTWLPLSLIIQHENNTITLPIWLYNDRVRKYKLSKQA